MPWRTEVLTEEGWVSKGYVFETQTEAQMYALDVAFRWKDVKDTRVVATARPTTHRYEFGRPVPVPIGGEGD